MQWRYSLVCTDTTQTRRCGVAVVASTRLITRWADAIHAGNVSFRMTLGAPLSYCPKLTASCLYNGPAP